MIKKFLLLLVLCVAAYIWALTTNPSREEYFRTLEALPTHDIWVSSNGWHTGIIVPLNQIPAALMPEKSAFAGEVYLEMGWGDAGFYQAEDITTGLALEALFSPTPSAVHLVGFSAEPRHFFAASQVLQLRVSEAGFMQLLEFMDASLSRKPSPAITRTEGLYGNSRFYAGSGEYTALHTCNHWAAHALVTAGVPITPWYAATTSALMWQLQRYAVQP